MLLAVCAWQAWSWLDARTPPDGAEVHRVTVEDRYASGRTSSRSNNVVLAFRAPDGGMGEVLYEDRLLGDHGTGDTIEVYRERGEWRTTVEQSPVGAASALGGVLLLLLLGRAATRMRREPGPPTESGILGLPPERFRDS